MLKATGKYYNNIIVSLCWSCVECSQIVYCLELWLGIGTCQLSSHLPGPAMRGYWSWSWVYRKKRWTLWQQRWKLDNFFSFLTCGRNTSQVCTIQLIAFFRKLTVTENVQDLLVGHQRSPWKTSSATSSVQFPSTNSQTFSWSCFFFTISLSSSVLLKVDRVATFRVSSLRTFTTVLLFDWGREGIQCCASFIKKQQVI